MVFVSHIPQWYDTQSWQWFRVYIPNIAWHNCHFSYVSRALYSLVSWHGHWSNAAPMRRRRRRSLLGIGGSSSSIIVVALWNGPHRPQSLNQYNILCDALVHSLYLYFGSLHVAWVMLRHRSILFVRRKCHTKFDSSWWLSYLVVTWNDVVVYVAHDIFRWQFRIICDPRYAGLNAQPYREIDQNYYWYSHPWSR